MTRFMSVSAMAAACPVMDGITRPKVEYNSRLYAINGSLPDIHFEFLAGYPDLLNESGRNIGRYYNFGTLGGWMAGSLLSFSSTPNHVFAKQAKAQPKFVGAKLIYSPDNGKTWRNQDGTSPVQWEKWEDRSKANMAVF